MTRKDKNTLVYVPVFNDFAVIEQIVEDIRGVLPSATVLLIDDGSTKVPFAASSVKNALHVRLPSNYGIGVCTHVAFDHAIIHEYDFVCRVDADGQHPVEHLSDMLQILSEQGADLVVGARIAIGSNLQSDPILRRWVRAYFSVCARLLTGNSVLKDVNTGFFALNIGAVRRLNTYQLERYPEPQLFVRAARIGLKMKLHSIERRDRLFGSSSLGLWAALKMVYRFNVLVLSEIMQRSER